MAVDNNATKKLQNKNTLVDNLSTFVLLNCIMGTAARLLKLHKGKNSGELIQNLKERYTHKDTPDLALSKWAFKNSLIGLQISP